MRLTLAVHPVTELRFADRTRLAGSRLEIDRDELRAHLLEDKRMKDVDLEIVRPGESARVGMVFDVVEPRAKEPGSGVDFPGILGPYVPAGQGTTHVLRGAAVSVLDEGRQPPSLSARGVNKILEMRGPAAEASAYGSLQHLVVAPHSHPELEWHTVKHVIRIAVLKAAVYLAKAAIGQRPATTEVYELDGPSVKGREGLLRVAYIGGVHGHQHGTEVDEHIIYGGNTVGMLPVSLHPNEWLDGALVTSYSWNGGLETYSYQNHPIIKELYRRHQSGEASFVGTVAMVNASLEEERNRNCMLAAHIAKWNLNAQAAIVTKYAGGAPNADMFETARICETMGIRTTVLVTDSAPDRRAESAILINVREVDAVVSMGSGQEIVWKVPAAERVIASNPAIATKIGAPQEVSGGQVCGVISNMGGSRISSILY